MKKNLLVAVLILAVITSLTAGTLAAYNKTLDSVAGDIHSKKFVFSGEGSETFNQKIKIVPGDKIEYKFYVTQSTEVPMYYTGKAVLSGDENLRKVLKTTVSAVDIGTNGIDMVDMDSAEQFSPNHGGGNPPPTDTDVLNVRKDAGDKTFAYKVVVEWKDDNNDALDVAASNQNAKLTFSLTGKGNEKGQTFNADNPVDTVLPIY